MRCTVFILVLFSIVLANPSFVLADFDLKEWRYEKPIQLPKISETQFVELTFDEEVFAKTASGLRDIRVISGIGEEVPYKLLIEKSTTERVQLSGQILDKSFIPDQHTSFVVDLGQAGLFHNQIDINSSSINFRREVVVEGSNDKSSWAVLSNKGIIYDYTDPAAGLKARNTRIRYPESTVRYLQIRINDQGEQPLNILRASTYLEKEIQAKSVSYAAAIINRSENEESRVTQLIVDLGSSGLPNNRLLIGVVAAEGNFQRDIGIEKSDDQEKWNILKSRDVIFSFNTPKFRGSKLEVSYPESTSRYLRITIFNQDNLPITIKEVQVFGILRKLVFEADPNQSYRLFYGNNGARYPQYDLERYFQYLETENLLRATLGAQSDNSSFEEKVPPPPPVTERFPWLLPVVLGVSIIGLGVFLFFLFWSVRKKLVPRDQQTDSDGDQNTEENRKRNNF